MIIFFEFNSTNFFKLSKTIIINKSDCNLSFVGLKTVVFRISKKLKSEKGNYHLAASFLKEPRLKL